MWAFRKEFDVRKSQKVPKEVPIFGIDDGNYVLCSKYVSIPLTNPAEDPMPSHWPPASTSSLESQIAPIAEYFVVGERNGTVSIVDVSGRNRNVKRLVHTHNNINNSSNGNEAETAVKREVIALDVLGTIVASIASPVDGADGSGASSEIKVSFVYPNVGDAIVTINSPQRSNVEFKSEASMAGKKKKSDENDGGSGAGDGASFEFRSVLLWEGHPRWANQPDEERMLYLFAGTEEGTVLLYKIDVVERRYCLHSYFAINVAGVDGTVSAIAADSSSSSSSAAQRGAGAASSSSLRRFTDPVYSLAVHDTNAARRTLAEAQKSIGKEEGAASAFHLNDAPSFLSDTEEEGDIHLIGGTQNRWACWPMRFVPWQSMASPMLLNNVVGGNSCCSSNTRVAATRVYGERSVVAAKGVGRVSDEKLRGMLVVIPFTPHEANRIFNGAMGSTETTTTSSDAKWRPKYDSVCSAAEVGTIMAVSHEEITIDAGDVDITAVTSDATPTTKTARTVALYQIMFPSLKKTVTWPACLFEIVNTQTLFGKGDQQGPIYSICPLGPKRMVTGGADGVVKVWEWGVPTTPSSSSSSSTPLYSLLHKGEGRHTDLVKAVLPLRAPDMFVSASYDGTIREWHIYDEPVQVMLCRNTTLCIPEAGVGGSGTVPSSSREGMGIATMSLVNGSRGLAVTGLFDIKIRTFAFVPVVGCELPDNMVFDGEKTRLIHPPAADVAAAEKAGCEAGDSQMDATVNSIDRFVQSRGL